MRKLIVIAALLSMSLSGKLFAQRFKSPAEHNYTTQYLFQSIRDFVSLPYGSIVFDLRNKDDYGRIRNLDSVLALLQSDIAFYRDSLDANATGGYRIDYSLNDKGRQIRFKHYSYDGDLYTAGNGGTSRLKVDQDTIKIWFSVAKEPYVKRIRGSYERGMAASRGLISGDTMRITPRYDIVVTFALNSYKDISKLRAEKDKLLHIIDTLEGTIPPRTVKKPSSNPRSSYYNPSIGEFRQYRGMAKTHTDIYRHADMFTINVAGGISAVRNTIAPFSEVVFSLNLSRELANYSYYHVFNLVAQPLFFFDKDAAGNHYIYDNWFINAEFGEEERDRKKDNFPNMSMGVGYLAFKKGDYFKGNTFKFYLSITNVKGILTYSPELIFTNDFKQIFPALSVKVRL